MSQPIRIQRKRTKGFNMQAQSPDGRPVVSVCRPGKWGNPFYIGGFARLNNINGYCFNYVCSQPWADEDVIHIKDAETSVRLYREWMAAGSLQSKMLNQIRGKHLACFCAPGAPCHADVLLKLANA